MQNLPDDFHNLYFQIPKFRTILSNDKSHFFIFYLAWTQRTIIFQAIFWPLSYSHAKYRSLKKFDWAGPARSKKNLI